MPRKNGSNEKITIIVQGYEVTLYFSDNPNLQVVPQVKQALLGTYLSKNQ